MFGGCFLCCVSLYRLCAARCGRLCPNGCACVLALDTTHGTMEPYFLIATTGQSLSAANTMFTLAWTPGLSVR